MKEQETKQVIDFDRFVIKRLELMEQRIIGNEVWIARAKNILERQSNLLQEQERIIEQLKLSVSTDNPVLCSENR